MAAEREPLKKAEGLAGNQAADKEVLDNKEGPLMEVQSEVPMEPMEVDKRKTEGATLE